MDPEDPDRDPDHSQNLITSSFYLFRHILKILSKSVHKVLSYLVHKCTNKQTEKKRENITSLAEVIMNFRPKQYRMTDFVFNLSGNFIEIVSLYKYLGVVFDEHLTFEKCSQVLAESRSRALGSIIVKSKKNERLHFKNF